MSTEDLSPPSTKNGIVDSNGEINRLSDADLAAIFKRLPPYERLLVSEVCKRWYAIASISWLDVTELDLSPIPVDNIATVVKRCPNLRVVSAAVRKPLRLSELRLLSRLNLFAVKLHDCTLDGCATASSSLFSGIPDAAWNELVLHEFLVRPRVPAGISSAAAGPSPSTWPDIFPAALKRLQITRRVALSYEKHYLVERAFERPLLQLPPLECLLLHETVFQRPEFLTRNRGSLRNLRELYLAANIFGTLWQGLVNLPNLQTLFLHDCYWAGDDDFDKLLTKHLALKIVAFTGAFVYNKVFPMRVRYANGYGADPLPVLHVFVGRMASEKIRFPKFPSDAAKVYPINEPLPQFLERKDIAPIFEGVWIAEKIKETGKNGSLLYAYEDHLATSLRSVDT